MTKLTRLNKLLAHKGLCSRREADEYIRKGMVKINGRIAELGDQVTMDDDVQLLPIVHKLEEQKMTVLLNKPLGIVSAQPEPGYTPAIRLLTNEFRKGKALSRIEPRNFKDLAVAGRLDINSTGLLVLTQSGVIAQQIIGPNSKIEKEYLVQTKSALNHDMLAQLREGTVEEDGTRLLAKSVDILNENQIRMVLTTGKHHQIRRMVESVGTKVTQLKRVRIGNVKLGNLPNGMWRFLLPHESF